MGITTIPSTMPYEWIELILYSFLFIIIGSLAFARGLREKKNGYINLEIGSFDLILIILGLIIAIFGIMILLIAIVWATQPSLFLPK